MVAEYPRNRAHDLAHASPLWHRSLVFTIISPIYGCSELQVLISLLHNWDYIFCIIYFCIICFVLALCFHVNVGDEQLFYLSLKISFSVSLGFLLNSLWHTEQINQVIFFLEHYLMWALPLSILKCWSGDRHPVCMYLWHQEKTESFLSHYCKLQQLIAKVSLVKAVRSHLTEKVRMNSLKHLLICINDSCIFRTSS